MSILCDIVWIWGDTMTPCPKLDMCCQDRSSAHIHPFGAPNPHRNSALFSLSLTPFHNLLIFLQHRSHICTTRAVQTPGSLLPKQVHSWSSSYTLSPETWAAWTLSKCSITHMPSTELGQQERGATALSTLLGLRLFPL